MTSFSSSSIQRSAGVRRDNMVLCIDDEPTGLLVRKMLLQNEGYQVLTALSGQEGLELFRRIR